MIVSPGVTAALPRAETIASTTALGSSPGARRVAIDHSESPGSTTTDATDATCGLPRSEEMVVEPPSAAALACAAVNTMPKPIAAATRRRRQKMAARLRGVRGRV